MLVFSGGNSPTTAERFPRGEAVHYAEHAIAQDVPADVTGAYQRLIAAGYDSRLMKFTRRDYQQPQGQEPRPRPADHHKTRTR